MIGTGEAPVLNDLPLWDMEEAMIERGGVDFGDNAEDHLRGEEALQPSSERDRSLVV